MANFHTNNLVIVAEEEDMKKVLRRMGMNLAANAEYTDFDISYIEDLDTVQELYYEVGPVVDAHYICAFAGAPLPEDVAAITTPGWTSPTSSEDGFLAQIQAMKQTFEPFSEGALGGVSLGLAVAPAGRGLSDTACLGFNRYGKNWVLTISYSTAWSPNSEDLDAFFKGLPTGNYGVAFYDADEYDGYETISVFNGLHHGRAAMNDVDGEPEWDTLEESELRERMNGYDGVTKAAVADLAELAKIVATCGWTEFDWDEDEECDDDDWDEDEECDDDDFDEEECDYDGPDESVDFIRRPDVNWINPKNHDLRDINQLVLSAVSSFPWCHRPDCGFDARAVEAAEHLFPGDAVRVTSDWKSFDTPGEVTVGVYDTAGTRVGIMGRSMDLYRDESWKNYSSSAVLACLLPHLTATVSEVNPVSLRSKGVEEPKLSVRFDIEPIDFEKLLAEVHALLEKDLGDRVLSSKGEE